MDRYDHLLVPIDFSAHSYEAARRALDLARRLGSRVEWLHVLHEGFIDLGYGHIAPPVPLDDGKVEEKARKRVSEFVQPLDRGDVSCSVTMRHGVPWEEILAHVEESSPDLVILGTHGRTGLQRAVLGSQSELVVRRCAAPVLMVRAPEGKTEEDQGS